MADTGIYATTAQCQAVIGANCSSTYNAEAYINTYIDMAESFINCLCRKVFAASTAAMAALPATTHAMLTEAATSFVAIKVLTADMSGMSRGEAEDRIVIWRDSFLRAIAVLRDKKVQNFLDTGVEN